MDPSASTNTFPGSEGQPASIPPQDGQSGVLNPAFSAAPVDAPGGAPPPDSATVTTGATGGGGGGRRRRVIMIAVAVILMLAGIASGTILLTRQQFERSFAWDCTLYNFEVDESGAVVVLNGSLRDLPAQVANVYIDGQLVAEFEVPALASGESATLGIVSVPEGGRFEWRVTGNKECEDTGSFLPSKTASCTPIKAFDEDWDPLTLQDLSGMEPGDIVRFTVGGQASTGTFEMARFTINGELREPVTGRRPGTDEFYDEYEIPEDTADFEIDAEVMHSEAGWI